MKLKQIAIPIENSPNRLYEFTRALDDKGINPQALTLVDTVHFGELRVLVSDTVKARQILMQNDIPGRIEDVVAVQIGDKPGELPEILAQLMEADIKVKYGYALARMNTDTTIMIFRFSDNDEAINVLKRKKFHLADRESIGSLEAVN